MVENLSPEAFPLMTHWIDTAAALHNAGSKHCTYGVLPDDPRRHIISTRRQHCTPHVIRSVPLGVLLIDLWFFIVSTWRQHCTRLHPLEINAEEKT